MKSYLHKRILVTVGDNDAPQMTVLRAISPNGKYGLFDDFIADGTVFGWLPLQSVAVLDVLGEMHEHQTALYQRLGKGER